MNKKFKKICSVALALAITATSAISMSASAFDISDADISFLSGYTIIDDKGMLKRDGNGREGYKILYHEEDGLSRAEPRLGCAEFILSEDVNYEEVNDRVIEIFKEFYPDNCLGVSEFPYLTSYTDNGVTTYTVSAGSKAAEARKYSKVFMKKLNEEKLISAFYDFGEIYFVSESKNGMLYSKNEDIDLIDNYIKENNIDCTIEKISNYRYILKSSDNDILKEFLIAVDIYEATSIAVLPISTIDTDPIIVYGKNALEDLETIIGDANGDGYVSIRDAAFIAILCAKRQYDDIPECADFNGDGKRNIRDAASIAIWFAREAIEQ